MTRRTLLVLASFLLIGCPAADQFSEENPGKDEPSLKNSQEKYFKSMTTSVNNNQVIVFDMAKLPTASSSTSSQKAVQRKLKKKIQLAINKSDCYEQSNTHDSGRTVVYKVGGGRCLVSMDIKKTFYPSSKGHIFSLEFISHKPSVGGGFDSELWQLSEVIRLNLDGSSNSHLDEVNGGVRERVETYITGRGKTKLGEEFGYILDRTVRINRPDQSQYNLKVYMKRTDTFRFKDFNVIATKIINQVDENNKTQYYINRDSVTESKYNQLMQGLQGFPALDGF